MSDTYRWSYEEPRDTMSLADDGESPEYHGEFNTREFEIRVGEAKGIFNDVMDAIDAAEEEWSRPVQNIVLGRHEYLALDVLYRTEYGHGVEGALSPIKIVTVPGRMIHVPKQQDKMIWEQLQR